MTPTLQAAEASHELGSHRSGGGSRGGDRIWWRPPRIGEDRMSFDLSNYVFGRGEGELVVMVPPTAGRITILANPANDPDTTL